MSEKVRIGLDNPSLAGRLRSYQPRTVAPVTPRGQTSHLRRVAGGTWSDVAAAQHKQPYRQSLNKSASAHIPKEPVTHNPIHDSFAAPQAARKERSRGNFMQKLLVGMAVVVFVIGVGVALQTFFVNKKLAGSHVSAQANNQEAQGPDETEPTQTDINSYTVSPDMPRFIIIPKINVKSRVRTVGTDSSNRLQAPSNVFDAAWYKDTVKPGSPGGTSLIDGHVSGWTKKGVFYQLKNLAAGDKIIIERGDGKQISYRVVASEKYDAASMDMSRALVSKNPSKPGLNLITCTGQVKAGSNEYEQRLLVFAEAE